MVIDDVVVYTGTAGKHFPPTIFRSHCTAIYMVLGMSMGLCDVETYRLAQIDLDTEKGKVEKDTSNDDDDVGGACYAMRHEAEVRQHEAELEAHDTRDVADKAVRCIRLRFEKYVKLTKGRR